MYNPFKPHIVQLYNNDYAIRRFSFGDLSWTYLDRIDEYWWNLNKHAIKWANFPNLIQANNRLREYTEVYNKRKHFARRVT